MNKKEEILTILQEECAEVTQAICKIKRFGIDATNPLTGQSNLDILISELGDLKCLLDLVIEYNIADEHSVNIACNKKREKLKKWSSIFS